MVSKLSQIGQILFKDAGRFPKSEEEAYLRSAKNILADRDFKLRWIDVLMVGIYVWSAMTTVLCFPLILDGVFAESSDISSEIITSADLLLGVPLMGAILVMIVMSFMTYAYRLCANQPELDWAENYRSKLNKLKKE